MAKWNIATAFCREFAYLWISQFSNSHLLIRKVIFSYYTDKYFRFDK